MLLCARRLTGRERVCIGAFLLLVMPAWLAPDNVRADAASITIASPKPGETIHDNAGNVAVAIVVQNDGAAQDASIRVLLDGQPYGPVQHSRSFTLTGVERGEHTLQVQLVNAAGKMPVSSNTVKFYMWQASRRFPGRK